MNIARPRVRFAPSPTGELHVGNARTALFNWLFARQHGGYFILRIEDTDQLRTTKTFEQNLLDDLRWLGIDWDEGPEIGGPFAPYHQTERLGIYNSHLSELIALGKVYPCYCSEEELAAERASLVARRMMPRYMGKCRNLTKEDRKIREDEGRRPAWRFRVEDGPIEFADMIRGAMKFDGRALGDFIIVRSNGLPAYNFAVVIDDHLMNISHVIRGEDHLSNTAVQILLYRAWGFSCPVFAHHSLILGKDRTKLSKRHGSVSVREFRSRGYLPEVLINYLALMGNSFGEGREVFDISEIIKIFSIVNTGKSAAIFDEDKLSWLNGIYIKKCPPEILSELLLPFMREAGYEGDHDPGYPPVSAIAAAVQGNLRTLSEIKDYLPIFNNEKYELSPAANALLEGEEARRIVGQFYESLNSRECPEKNYYEWAINSVQLSTSMKGRTLFLPIRCALTGCTQGPELDKLVAVLGKPAVIKRLLKSLHRD
ncbi:MAG: glutamate--tRNA ligase [Deltaproteobacteria bacterium]|nr:glutamate--tRNA ligase [Deltaproteobacteria bacterium]